METTTKKCTKCGRELPIESFNKNKKNLDGYQYYCKECGMEYSRANYQKAKARKQAKEMAEFEKKHKIYTNKDLAKFQPVELMLELKARGYEGELLYREVKVTEHRINLNKLN